jgi:hypothetical protein
VCWRMKHRSLYRSTPRWIVHLGFSFQEGQVGPLTRTQLLKGHSSEMVRDGDQWLVGCTCGWTCSGSCDGEIFAIEIFHLHMHVVFDLLNRMVAA